MTVGGPEGLQSFGEEQKELGRDVDSIPGQLQITFFANLPTS
jgi:hypothetical protein